MKKTNKLSILIILLIVICIFNPFSLEKIVTYINNISNSDKIDFILDDSNSIEVSGSLISDEEASKLNNSSLTGDNYQFNIEYYPYYGLLNDNEKKLYKQIYANANALVYEFVPNMNISVEEVKETFEAFYNDHPELFWINTSYSYKYTINNRCIEVILSYNETAEDLEKYKKIFNQAANKIINNANRYSSNYEKEKYVHDYLINNIVYDKSASMHQSAYSAIVSKRSICAGYTRAFQYIMIQLKIPTYYCVGVASVNHAWNIVKLDGEYYNVDLTWNDTKSDRYKYFNRTDKYFASSHKRTGLSIYLPKCLGSKYHYENNTSNENISNSYSTSNAIDADMNKQSSDLINEDERSNLSSNDISNYKQYVEEKEIIDEKNDIILEEENIYRKGDMNNGENTIINGGY